MRYLQKINETIKNQQYLRYCIKRMVLDIFKIIKITGENLHRHKDRIHVYRLDINLPSIDNSIINKVEKIVIKYKSLFLRNNMIMSFDKHIYPRLEFDDDFNFKPTNEYYTKFSIYVKSLFTNRVKPKRYIYHFSPSENRDSILSNGLIPKPSEDSVRWSKETELSYPPLIFAVNDDDEAGWYYVSKVDVWQIDTSKIDNIWWHDLNNKYIRTDLIMTDKPIPISALKLVKSLVLPPLR